MILFAVGSALALSMNYFAVYLVDDFSQLTCTSICYPFATGVLGSIFIVFSLSIVPFFLIALGLYFIFQPMFNSASGMVASRERKEASLEFQSGEAGKFKGMSNDELQKELVRMKTIEHVLLARENSSLNSKPDDMSQTLANAQDRIAAIEEEISMRRAAQNPPRMRSTQPGES
jgi:hypothetical protein